MYIKATTRNKKLSRGHFCSLRKGKFVPLRSEGQQCSLKEGPCHVDSSRPTAFTFKEKCRTLAQNF